MQNILEKLLGGSSRIKLMRLFLFNPQTAFLHQDIADRAKISSDRLRSELAFLHGVRLLKKAKKSGGKNAWSLNERFPFLGEFQRLLLETSLMNRATLLKRISKTGRLKIVILTGLFKEIWESQIDILIVADNVKSGQLDSTVKTIEAELGREIRYCALDTQDFKYRLGVGDRLIRDVLDYPHEVVLDRIGAF
jgi:hypothetical protein